VVDINDFPAELRWKLAAKSASTLPLAQEKIYKDILGQKYKKIRPLIDTINYISWIQGGKDASVLSNYLGLPTKTAEEVDKAQRLISMILYGPEIQYDVVGTDKNNVKTKITSCPFLNRSQELGLESENLFENCKAYNKTFIDNLNPKYTKKFTKAMCMGDECCETRTELR
jgi:hypothetical protein